MEQRNNIITQEGKLRWHHGLGTAIAMVLIFSLVMNYIVPSRLPYVEAATVTKTWSADADFNNNDVTSEGATTIVQATTTGAGAVQLNLVGTSSVSEAFSDETNFNTGSSSAIISSGSLKIGSSSWTQTDWTDGTATTSTATGFSASTNITTSSGAFTATSGDGTLTSNIFNTKFADGGATWATSSWTTSATPTTTVKIRTSNDSAMSGATAFASCNSLTSGADISSNNCVTDGNQYVQYQVGLSLGTVGWNISPATSSLKSFSVTSQEGSPYTASFSSDGTKMYVVGLNNDRVYQYALSSAWDVSTASYASVSSSVASQDGTPTDISFSSDGTKMYMVGETNDKVHQYALSSAWDVSTASYASVSSSVTSQDGTPTDISFSSDGTKMYVVGLNNDRVYQYALSSAWDLSTASYASVSSSVTSQDSLPLGISFSSDGTKMYMVGQTNDKVHQYSLGTAWNVSTASYSSVSSSVSSQDGNSTDISFSSDGTKMYMVGITNDKVHQYSLGTAWDLSTVQVNWFSVTSQDTTPSDITFSSDGTKMYIMGYANNKVHQYALSTAWNVSTASYASVSSSVASQDTLPFGFTFSSDGTKMYMAGNTNDKVHQYALSSAWNVSTASYASVSSSVASQDSVPGGIAFSSDGTKMYILGNSSDKIYQYALGTAWDLSTASYASVSSSALTSQENSPRGIFFSSDGTKVYVDGETNDKVHQYSLGTAWNVSTISYANVSSSVSSQDGNPMGISFSSDGTKMYMVGSDTDAVYQYTLSTTTAAASLTDITINFTPASGVYRGESNTVDSLGTGIRFAKLGATSTPGTGSIAYYLSNDAGTNWSTTTVGTILTFSTTTGSALRWRADLTGNATVEDVSVDYNGYYATGTVRNLKIDANGDATWNTISWNVTAPAGTEAKFRTRGTNISEGEGALSSATWSSYYATSTNSATITSSSANPIFRWLEVEIFLNTGTGATDVNGGNTPSAEDFSLTYVINTPPQFDSTYGTQGQTVEQLATSSEDDWGKVRIIYSVRDTDTASGTLALQSSSTSFEYRLTSSDSWTAITNATLNSGATSSKTMSETVYSAVTRNVAATSTNAMWDAKTQLGQIYSTSVQTRVTVNDGDSLNNTSSSISAAFTLDTANPTSTTFRLDSSTSTNDVHFSFTDNTNIQYRFSSTSLTTSSEAVAWTSAGATSASGSSTPSGGFGGNASSGEIVYYQIRDSFGNYTTSSATAPGITGDNQTRITIKDTSNPTIGNYREFISWRAYVATSGATFSAYEVWRSTTTETAYTLLTSITDSAVNYYTDDAVSNGTTYYYKVRFKDTDTDYSAFSASATDAPDGQGGTDVVTPTITSIATSTVQTTWATVTWTTDELATSAVRVGTSALSYNTTSTLSNVYKTSHSETVSGLASGTLYYFQVRSTDASGNEKTDSNGSSDYTFQTLVGPTITGVAIKSVQDATATIRWSTDVAATSAINYSLNSNLSSPSNLTSSSQVSGERELNISGLSGSTLYYFEVRSTASSGAVETVETNRGDYYSFRTTNDTTPPVISNIDVPVKTTASATVTWSTNEPATSQVEWGTVSGTYPSSTTKSSVLTKEHAVTMTGLTQATTYYFRVKSQDGNPSSAEAVSSEQSFVSPTPETVTVTNTVTVSTVSSGGGSRELPRDEIPPVIKFIEIPKVTPFEALITFVTNEPTLSFVDYGQTEQYDQLAANKKFEETHAITLKNLRIGKAYNYRLKVIDKGGNDTFSENKTFRTPFLVENIDTRVEVESFDVVQEEIENALESILPSIVPPFIEEPKVASTTETTAVITWKTNIGSYSTVSYVPEGEYNPLSLNPYRLEVSETEKKVREHQMELTNLTPNTKYHFQAKSFSLPKSIGKSADLTFVTKASKIEPKIASVQKTSITVNWQTNEPATSIIDYTNLTTGKRERVIDNRQDTNHSIQLENLTPDTAYRVETLGVNKNGNILEAAGDLTVRTQKDVLAPEVTSLNISNTLIPGRTDLVQTTITWKTNEPASSIIEYQEGATKTGDTLEQREEKQNLETTDHSFTITKLSPGRIYQVRALSEDEAGNVGSSPVRMIVTPRQSESIFDVVIRNFEDSFQFVRKLR